MLIYRLIAIYWSKIINSRVNDVPSTAQAGIISTDLPGLEGVKGQHADVSSLVDMCCICRCTLTSDFRFATFIILPACFAIRNGAFIAIEKFKSRKINHIFRYEEKRCEKTIFFLRKCL